MRVTGLQEEMSQKLQEAARERETLTQELHALRQAAPTSVEDVRTPSVFFTAPEFTTLPGTATWVKDITPVIKPARPR